MSELVKNLTEQMKKVERLELEALKRVLLQPAQYQASGDLPLTQVGVQVDIPGCATSIRTTRENVILSVIGCFEFRIGSVNTVSIARGYFTVDGVDAPTSITYTANGNPARSTLTMPWVVNLPIPGTYNVKLRAEIESGVGPVELKSRGTKLAVMSASK